MSSRLSQLRRRLRLEHEDEVEDGIFEEEEAGLMTEEERAGLMIGGPLGERGLLTGQSSNRTQTSSARSLKPRPSPPLFALLHVPFLSSWPRPS